MVFTGKLHLGQDGKPLSGVGRGIGLHFVEAYFPEARHTLRIASGYFRINGYELSRASIGPEVRLHILVSRGEGRNVDATLVRLVQEILEELGRTDIPLCDAVEDLIHRIERGQFVIRGAWETQNSYRFHCKFYVMDDKCMWSGSANYTRPGLDSTGNEEQASLSRDANDIKMFTQFYEEILVKSVDLLQALHDCLQTWLGMADPYDAYLKTLYYWYGLESFQVGPKGKTPTYYQAAIVTRAVRQIRDYNGALLLIATGLGKTVIGAETARRFTEPYPDKRIIVLAPKSIKKQWDDELSSRYLKYEYFDNGLLFKQQSNGRDHQITQLLEELKNCNSKTILVIDEAHRYRKILQKDVSLRRRNRSRGEIKRNLVKERIADAVKNGAKILLLTATPYGTDRQDINSLLHLLPGPTHSVSIDYLGSNSYWKVELLDQLPKQPVVIILGMLHLLKMASQRGDVEDDKRIFIAMEGTPSRKYLPSKIILYREEFPLFLQPEIQSAFANHVFEAKPMPMDFYNEEEKRHELGAADTVQNTAIQAWLSSPAEFKRFAQSCSEAPDRKRTQTLKAQLEMTELFSVSDEANPESDPGEDKETLWLNHKAVFKVSQEIRQKILIPLIYKMEKIRPQEDEKFMRLQRILVLHIHQKHKVVVFVKRYATAVYLLEILAQTDSNIRVGCTVQREGAGCRLKSAAQRKDTIEHFCPRSSEAKDITEAQETDVLICTDIDGVGINMQDACVVINYDLPPGADELFQRAGRILRMTVERDRVVHLYTFEPALDDRQTQVAANIARRLDRLRTRHNNAQGLATASILPNVSDWAIPIEIPLACPKDIDSMSDNPTLPEEWLQEQPNSDLTHLSLLERNAQKAKDLQITMLSAKNTTHQEPLVFVLLRHDGEHYLLLYAINRQKIVPFNAEETLKLLQCDATEQKAIIRPQVVEKKALEAVKMWCEENQLDPADCEHLCVIYLKPNSNQEQDLTDMLVGESRNRI